MDTSFNRFLSNETEADDSSHSPEEPSFGPFGFRNWTVKDRLTCKFDDNNEENDSSIVYPKCPSGLSSDSTNQGYETSNQITNLKRWYYASDSLLTQTKVDVDSCNLSNTFKHQSVLSTDSSNKGAISGQENYNVSLCAIKSINKKILNDESVIGPLPSIMTDAASPLGNSHEDSNPIKNNEIIDYAPMNLEELHLANHSPSLMTCNEDLMVKSFQYPSGLQLQGFPKYMLNEQLQPNNNTFQSRDKLPPEENQKISPSHTTMLHMINFRNSTVYTNQQSSNPISREHQNPRPISNGYGINLPINPDYLQLSPSYQFLRDDAQYHQALFQLDNNSLSLETQRRYVRFQMNNVEFTQETTIKSPQVRQEEFQGSQDYWRSSNNVEDTRNEKGKKQAIDNPNPFKHQYGLKVGQMLKELNFYLKLVSQNRQEGSSLSYIHNIMKDKNELYQSKEFSHYLLQYRKGDTANERNSNAKKKVYEFFKKEKEYGMLLCDLTANLLEDYILGKKIQDSITQSLSIENLERLKAEFQEMKKNLENNVLNPGKMKDKKNKR